MTGADRPDSPRPARRKAVFQPEFREDLRFWVENNRKEPLRVMSVASAARPMRERERRETARRRSRATPHKRFVEHSARSERIAGAQQDIRRTGSWVALRALDLVEAILRDPFHGIGKPEPLKRFLAGAWSRRLTEEHRIVYVVSADRVDFLQARYHY